MASDFDVALGVRLRRARYAARMTQMQLATDVGISQVQLRKYEIGANRLTVARMVAIARVLAVSPMALIGEAL